MNEKKINKKFFSNFFFGASGKKKIFQKNFQEKS